MSDADNTVDAGQTPQWLSPEWGRYTNHQTIAQQQAQQRCPSSEFGPYDLNEMLAPQQVRPDAMLSASGGHPSAFEGLVSRLKQQSEGLSKAADKLEELVKRLTGQTYGVRPKAAMPLDNLPLITLINVTSEEIVRSTDRVVLATERLRQVI